MTPGRKRMAHLSKAAGDGGLHKREAAAVTLRKWVNSSGILEVEVTTLANGGGCKREELLMTDGRTHLTLSTWVSAFPWLTVLFFWRWDT